MYDRNEFDSIPVTAARPVDDASDGAAVALAEPPLDPGRVRPLSEIDGLDGYLQSYGKILGRKAIHALDPLHVPDRDTLPDFSDIPKDREPFPCQAHVIAAAVKMMDESGSGFIVGEMGTGKTLLGMVSVHKHAQRSRKQGGSGGKYRALVLCPDHLIGKWCRELEETVPDAIVTRFGPQGDEVVTKGKKKVKLDPGTRRSLRDTIALLSKKAGRRWEKPQGAEWYVMGRNQAKWLSDWAGLSDERRGFNGELGKSSSSKLIVVDQPIATDEKGYPVYDKNGNVKRTNVTARVHYCPKCGTVVRDAKGVPVGEKDLSSQSKITQKRCEATYLQMIADPDHPEIHGLDRICPVPGRFAEKKPADRSTGRPADVVNMGGRKYRVTTCGEPLYNYTASPYRWSLASIIKRKMKRMFKYLVVDEVHEQKSDESAQSMACGKLIGSVDHVLALTGTIIGGYAHHLFPLMIRLNPESLRDEGFEWGKDMAFSEIYGRIDKIVTTKEQDSGSSVSANTKSMRRARSGNVNVRKCIRPGVMPTMFGAHMIGSSMFITLDEMSSELPDLFEYIGGELRSWAVTT